MFLCLACLLEQRDYIIKSGKDYQDIAMYFDKLVRSHDVSRVLVHARRLFAEYLNEDWTPSPQPAGLSQVTPIFIFIFIAFFKCLSLSLVIMLISSLVLRSKNIYFFHFEGFE